MPKMTQTLGHAARLAGAIAIAASVALPALAQDKPMLQGFRDDFTAPMLNTKRWYVSHGWTNGKHQDCEWSKKAVAVKDGFLHLSHIPAEGDDLPLCGEIQTHAFLKYGTIEARISAPRASGLNASVFTYTGPTFKAPHDEIDVEVLTRDTSEITFNTFVSGKMANGEVVPVDPPIDEEFHTIAMKWEPDRIIWYLDGEEVHRTAEGSPLPENPQKIYMSFWSTTMLTEWMGEQGPREGPLDYRVDWLAYTPPDQDCLFEGSVTC